MNNYLNNNILLINEYEKLYLNGISINDIISKFHSGGFNNYSAFDYGRFRVFIDSCLLLFNKEKLNRYIKDGYSYAKFFDMVENDPQLASYLSYIKNDPIFSDVKMPCIFSSIEGKEKRAWDQVATIRNAFAHMQYGNFTSQENGLMIFYGIYNKDKGIKKDEGIVFEPVLHEFVKSYFSNYSFGIPFRASFFMKYSLKDKRETLEPRFYEITLKENVIKEYDGYSSNILSDLIKQLGNCSSNIISYIYKNESKYVINEYIVDEKINLNDFEKCARKYQLNTDDKYYYGLKVFLDFESEISNFLVHIEQLNDILYDYSVIRKSNDFTQNQVEDFLFQLEKRIIELSEDESANLAFKIVFLYLKILNFALRMEDDDYEPIDYSLIDVSKFLYDNEALKKYIADNYIVNAPIQKYVIERVRNSLMHGNVNCEVTQQGEILVVFTDSFNKRKDVIKILLKELKHFLSQKILYSGIPIQTEILMAEKLSS